LHQVGDLFELNVKLRCPKVKYPLVTMTVYEVNFSLTGIDIAYFCAIIRKPSH